jgi:hypothetical protein
MTAILLTNNPYDWKFRNLTSTIYIVENYNLFQST